MHQNSRLAYYQKQISQAREELDQARAQLKHQDTLRPKERKRLHKRVCQLYEELREWKYRAEWLRVILT